MPASLLPVQTSSLALDYITGDLPSLGLISCTGLHHHEPLVPVPTPLHWITSPQIFAPCTYSSVLDYTTSNLCYTEFTLDYITRKFLLHSPIYSLAMDYIISNFSSFLGNTSLSVKMN